MTHVPAREDYTLPSRYEHPLIYVGALGPLRLVQIKEQSASQDDEWCLCTEAASWPTPEARDDLDQPDQCGWWE